MKPKYGMVLNRFRNFPRSSIRSASRRQSSCHRYRRLLRQPRGHLAILDLEKRAHVRVLPGLQPYQQLLDLYQRASAAFAEELTSS